MSEDEYDMGDLDAESLAVVAEVEQRFQQNVNLENRAPQNAFPPKPTTALPTKPTQERFIRPPPAKRVRTNDWNASTLQNRSESDEDMLDFAVIAAGDGTYRVLNASNGIPKINLSTNSSTSQPKALTRLEQPPRPAPPRILHHPTSNSLRRAPSQSNLRPANSQHAVNASQSRIAAITAALAESDDSGDENELAKLRAQIREVYSFVGRRSLSYDIL